MELNRLAVPHVPVQQWNQTYDLATALAEGTIFPELNKCFFVAPENSNTTLPKDGNVNILYGQVAFAADDARLYLDTHPDDTKAAQYYQECLQKKKELQQDGKCGCCDATHYQWEKNPLVWEGGHC